MPDQAHPLALAPEELARHCSVDHFSFKTTAEMTKMTWLGAVMASANEKGEIVSDAMATKQAFELGVKAATP